MSKLSYMLFGGTSMPTTGPLLSGLFSWVEAFKMFGKNGARFASLSKDTLENYDIVHVNFTPGASTYALAVRDRLGAHSDTKVILNVDFAVGMWNTIDPFILKKVCEAADYLFHVEPVGAIRLERLTGRDVETMPHPVDVKALMARRSEVIENRAIACHYHRYNNTWDPYYYATMNLRKDYDDVRTVLFGTMDSEKSRTVAMNSMFDETIQRMGFEEYIKMFSACFASLDTTPDYTYGRSVVEAAALGIPTVACSGMEAAHRCFPELVVDRWTDDFAMEEGLRRVLEDDSFTEDVVKYATEAVKYYDLRPCVERMTEMIEN